MLFRIPLEAYTDSLNISALGKGMKYADFIADRKLLIHQGLGDLGGCRST